MSQYCYTQSKSNYEVILGAHDRHINEPTQKTFLVKEIIQHPNFNSKTRDYDYGIIKLYNPVSFNGYMSPVCLPDKDTKLDDNIKTYLTGWGYNPTRSSKLQEIDYQSMSNTECAEKTDRIVYHYWGEMIASIQGKYDDYIDKALTSRMTCVGAGQHKGACQGDKGSPSVVKMNDWISLDYYLQTGVLSKGSIVCNEQGCNCTMGIAAKVKTEINWIEKQITGKRCHKPKIPGCNDPSDSNPHDDCDP